MLLALIRKELLALGRDIHGMGALFIMPVIFIVVMSLALKNVYDAPRPASLTYAVDARDTGEQAKAYATTWARSHGAPVPLPADWQERLRAGSLKYVLVLEAGLSDELALPSFPTSSRVRLLTEPGLDGNLFNTLKAELAGAAGELKARAALSETDATPPKAGASMADLVTAERHAGSGPRPTAVQHNVPAWLVFGMFFVIASVGGLFVQERQGGTLARLRSLGVPRSTLLASKALPYIGVNLVQAALMLAVGVWAMPLLGGDALSLRGIHWGALLVAVGAVSLAAVGLALVLACAVRSHAQAFAVGPILNVLMAAVGGIMVPTFVMPAVMQKLAAWSPMNWALEALLTVLLRGGDVAATLPHVGRLVAFAALMWLLAVVLFRKSSR